MAFTTDPKYAPIMKKLSLGNIGGQIRKLYSFLFNWNEEGEQLGEDFEKKDLMIKMHGFL
jgi:hypothetical protein